MHNYVHQLVVNYVCQLFGAGQSVFFSENSWLPAAAGIEADESRKTEIKKLKDAKTLYCRAG